MNKKIVFCLTCEKPLKSYEIREHAWAQHKIDWNYEYKTKWGL